jgi:hypothetical protein
MYTVEIYKKDARKKSGERLFAKVDYPAADDLLQLERDMSRVWRASKGFRVSIHETYITKKNLMGGGEFTERYDTPHYCSPASESYWSM